MLSLASTFKSPGALKKANASAYKALRLLKLVDVAYPKALRDRRQPYSIEEISSTTLNFAGRGPMQLALPAMYNAAKRLNLLDKLFPVVKNKKKWTKETLTEEAQKYTSRQDFYDTSPGAHSVACKLGLLDDIGLPDVLQGVSTQERGVLDFLKKLSPDFKTKRFSNDYELDCYSESLKLGVEYNGLYWHSEGNKSRRYHLNKTKYFEALGIRVIHIWEHEWRDRQAQVKGYLMSACKANTTVLGARKCVFKEIDPALARSFLFETHIQGGRVNIKYALGCFFKDKLIGVCTFGTHHRTGASVVLNRFACLIGYSVPGFLSKASKLAFKKLGRILSWADYSKSQGKGYLAAGWKLLRTLPVDYFYANSSGELVSKQARRKSVVNTPVGMTESEHAKKDGLYKIWDCGKLVLIYDPEL